MINNALAWIAKWAVGKNLLGAVVWVHDKLDGHKSEVITALIGIIHGLKIAGLLDPVIALTAETALLGALTPAAMSRVKKVVDLSDRLAPELPKP
jgi:hypothetical protein